MNIKEIAEAITNNKLLVFVITSGSGVILFLAEIQKRIELNNLWKASLYCILIFGSIYLLATFLIVIYNKISNWFYSINFEISEYEYTILEFFSRLPEQGILVDEISGVEETEKRYILQQLVDKGLLSNYMNYYSLTHNGREQLLLVRQKRKAKQ
ncbi:MAG: hypothetical protein JNJ93_07730 [Acinetobacter sp.]|nr:hypothetical protein [Acinetobacter sp.]